jgi:hypothetical protein
VDEILVPASRRFWAYGFGLALALLAACGAESRPSVGPPLPGPVAGVLADPARDVGTVSGAATAFYQGLLADSISGDVAAAAAWYERALGDVTLGRSLVGRAALRWAALEAAAGRTRRSIELLARAGTLGDGDPALTDLPERLQGSLGLGSAEVEVRGPPLGTPPPGDDAAATTRFIRAEALLARAHRLRVRPVMGVVLTSIRNKEQATEAAVRALREVASDGPIAIAAEYRIGGLYHDLALALVFEPPPQFDPGVAARLRRSLRVSTIAYLRKAVTAYRRALDRAGVGAGTDKWRAAAQSDLRGALDTLGEP